MGRRQDKRAIIEAAEEMGYRLDGPCSGGAHLKWRAPAGNIVITGTDLGDARSWKNAVSALKRGLKMEPFFRK